MSDPRTPDLSRIRRAAAFAEARMRAARAFSALPGALTLAVGFAALVLAVRKTLPAYLSEARARELLVSAGVLVALWVVAAALRRLPPRAGTMALDKHHGLDDRLTNATSFAERPEAQRSPLMELAIDDACAHAPRLSARKAVPIPVPRDMAVPLVLGAFVLAIAMLEVRVPVREVPQAKTLEPLLVMPDDIELFKDAAKALAREDQTQDVKAAIEQFNQLILDLANRRLDRTEAFRRMEAIERDLLKGAEADRKALEEALRETGEELAKSDLAKPLGESLQKKDFEKAKKDLKDLADRLRDKKKKPDKAALDRLRNALEKASKKRKEALAAINEKRAELREQLLKKRKKDDPDAGAPDPQEEKLLKKKERELERLDREAEQQERASRQLDRLDRELAKAAEDLMRDMGLSADDLQQAAEDINRLQEEAMSDKEKEELRQRLEELRELLRQQGPGGKQRIARMLRFGKRARGGSGEQGERGQQGDGQGQDGQEGEEGEGDEGDGQKPGGGNKGEGGQKWVIGPGGKKVLMLSKGSGSMPGGGGQGQGQQGGDKGGQDQGGGKGDGIGSGHDSSVAGQRTDPKMETHDVQAEGLDSKEGPTNSEVILSAAERGFRGSPYKKVYTQYRTVAEQQIGKDQVPDGYRFYVHRYFQLIRPRE